MNAWYQLIRAVLGSAKDEDNDVEMTRQEDFLSNYMELEALMQVMDGTRETGPGC